MHAAQAGQGRVVFVYGTPVLPSPAESIRLGLVLEEVCDLAHEGAEGIGGGFVEESKKGVNELFGGDGTLVVGGYVGSEGGDLGLVAAEQIRRPLNDSAVTGEARSLLWGHGGKISNAEAVHGFENGLRRLSAGLLLRRSTRLCCRRGRRR